MPTDRSGGKKLARQHLSRLAERLLANVGGEDDLKHLREMITDLTANFDLRKRVALLIRDYYSDHMRPEIRKFAGLMEMKLVKHDPSRGERWKEGDVAHHMERIHAIVEELAAAVGTGKMVGLKSADLANHAMMLADIAGELEDV